MSPSVDVDPTSILIDLPLEIFELKVGFEPIMEGIRFLDHELFKLFVFELFEHAKLVSHLVYLAGEMLEAVQHEFNHVEVNVVSLVFVPLVTNGITSVWNVSLWIPDFFQLVHNLFDCGLEPEIFDRFSVSLPFFLLPLILL